VQKAQQRMINLAAWQTVLLLIVGFALLAWQVYQLLATLPTGVTIFEAGWQITTNTRWGIYWVGRQLLLFLLIVSLFSLRQYRLTALPGRLRTAWGIATLLLIALIAVQASMGHAAAAAEKTAVSITISISVSVSVPVSTSTSGWLPVSAGVVSVTTAVGSTTAVSIIVSIVVSAAGVSQAASKSIPVKARMNKIRVLFRLVFICFSIS